MRKITAVSETNEHDISRFEGCLHTGYIDSTIESDNKLAPQFVSNNTSTATNMLAVIKQQLKDCFHFDFSVAFIAEGGLQALIETLNYLRDNEITGRFLTSTYLNFNSPEALRKLLEYPNIETRVYQGNMHAKGYFFTKENLSTVIIGSSNLTQAALTCNQEWNVLFHSFSHGKMLQTAIQEYDRLWNSELTTSVTMEWINQYQQYCQNDEAFTRRQKRPFTAFESSESENEQDHPTIIPNKMQSRALEALACLHSKNEPRALLVSATGTGKTYLSAFDVKAVKPERVLFLAHRKRILEAAEESFRTVLGKHYSYEQYSAGLERPDTSCVFAMVSMLSRHLTEFEPDYFDYIIIDEAHRAGASSYQAIMDYFTPHFYLGMTATPSRTDGFDVFSLFNHVIAYRITLKDALENEMLTPFHYFGIADLEINDEVVDDPSLFAKLTSEERVKHITNKIEEYSVSKRNRRGLVFCNRNDEAESLSTQFNMLGYKTIALSGRNSDVERNEGIAKLEDGEIEYIFTVDIFNEGIDIPSLNQIIMLRRTESPIVFVQQLGRGLRKTDDKEYTLVLDFIGNYQRNYFVPIALSGDRTYNKDNLRVFIKEGSTIIPGCSTISFDRVSETRIFRALDEGKFSASKLIRDEYENLKQVLGRIPSLLEFDENESIDPLIIFNKYGSYHAFLEKYEKTYSTSFTLAQCNALKFISRKMANGKRIEDLVLIKLLVDQHSCTTKTTKAAIQQSTKRTLNTKTMRSSISFLASEFSSSDEQLATYDDERIFLSPSFMKALENGAFKQQVLEVINFGIARGKKLYSNTYKDTSFVLYAKYTYEEVCKLLNWEKNMNGQNIGGYMYDKQTNTFPVFINYDKDPDIESSIKYEDRFVSDDTIIAISKQPRKLNSPEIERLRNWPANSMKSYLFVRKNKDDKDGGKEFYFLGEIFPTGQFEAIMMPGTTKSAVEIMYRLDKPVRADIYDYLTSNI